MPHKPRINTETAEKSQKTNTSSSKISSKSSKRSSKKKKTDTNRQTSRKWSNLERNVRKTNRNANNTGNKKTKFKAVPTSSSKKNTNRQQKKIEPRKKTKTTKTTSTTPKKTSNTIATKKQSQSPNTTHKMQALERFIKQTNITERRVLYRQNRDCFYDIATIVKPTNYKKALKIVSDERQDSGSVEILDIYNHEGDIIFLNNNRYETAPVFFIQQLIQQIDEADDTTGIIEIDDALNSLILLCNEASQHENPSLNNPVMRMIKNETDEGMDTLTELLQINNVRTYERTLNLLSFDKGSEQPSHSSNSNNKINKSSSSSNSSNSNNNNNSNNIPIDVEDIESNKRNRSSKRNNSKNNNKDKEDKETARIQKSNAKFETKKKDTKGYYTSTPPQDTRKYPCNATYKRNQEEADVTVIRRIETTGGPEYEFLYITPKKHKNGAPLHGKTVEARYITFEKDTYEDEARQQNDMQHRTGKKKKQAQKARKSSRNKSKRRGRSRHDSNYQQERREANKFLHTPLNGGLKYTNGSEKQEDSSSMYPIHNLTHDSTSSSSSTSMSDPTSYIPLNSKSKSTIDKAFKKGYDSERASEYAKSKNLRSAPKHNNHQELVHYGEKRGKAKTYRTENAKHLLEEIRTNGAKQAIADMQAETAADVTAQAEAANNIATAARLSDQEESKAWELPQLPEVADHPTGRNDYSALDHVPWDKLLYHRLYQLKDIPRPYHSSWARANEDVISKAKSAGNNSTDLDRALKMELGLHRLLLRRNKGRDTIARRFALFLIIKIYIWFKHAFSPLHSPPPPPPLHNTYHRTSKSKQGQTKRYEKKNDVKIKGLSGRRYFLRTS